MVKSKDWRLTNQEKYLKGKTLYLKKWSKTRENWDHDHCNFCWAEFTDYNIPNVLHEGYTTKDDYYWICKKCFGDFKKMFKWKVEKSISENNFENLIQSIQLLAADYKTQISSLPKFVHVPDELALLYNDYFLLSNQFLNERLITKQQLKNLKELDKTLDKMSGKKNAKLWTLEALKESQEWKNIRNLASKLLKDFGKRKEKPKINPKTYVKG